jgi:hypothetical protein
VKKWGDARINGELIEGASGEILGAGIAQKGDTVEVTTTVSDGKDQTESRPASLVVGDAEPYMFVDVPEVLEQGALLNVAASIIDPDAADVVDQVPVLIAGPQGMTMDASGNVQWSPASLPIDAEYVSFSVAPSEGELASAQTFRVTLEGSNGDHPTAIPTTGQPSAAWAAADFISGGQLELVSLGTDQTLVAAQLADGTLEPAWMYPYALPTEGRGVGLFALPVEGGRTNPLIVVTEHGVSRVEAVDTRALLLWETDQKITAAAMADLNGNGIQELALVIEERVWPYANEIVVLDLADPVAVTQSASLPEATSQIVIGNVEGDLAQEIVTDSGCVFDSTNWAPCVQRDYLSAERIALADWQGDGVLEVVTSRRGSEVEILSAESGTLIATLPSTDASHMVVSNINATGGDEIFIANSGRLSAYGSDASGQPAEIWWTQSGGYTPRPLAVANFYPTEGPELLWRDGKFRLATDLSSAGSGAASMEIVTNGLNRDDFSALGAGNVGANHRVVFRSREQLVVSDGDGNYDIRSLGSTGPRDAILGDYNLDGDLDLYVSEPSDAGYHIQIESLADGQVLWHSPDYGTVPRFDPVKVWDGSPKGVVFFADDFLHYLPPLADHPLRPAEPNDGLGDADVHISSEAGSILAQLSGSQKGILRIDTAALSPVAAIEAGYQRVIFGNYDGDAGVEVALINLWSSDFRITIYDWADGELQPLLDHDVAGLRVKDVTINPTRDNYQTLILVTDEDGTRIAELSPLSGLVLWEGPRLRGGVFEGNLWAGRALTGGLQVLLATTMALYIM